MTKTFKQYFYENDQIYRLEHLLNNIEQTIKAARQQDDALEPEHVDQLKQQIGELYDELVQADDTLPDHLQGGPGERPKHIQTMRDLNSLVQASVEKGLPIPEDTRQQMVYLSNMFTENDLEHDKKPPNPFLKPKWARERDSREAAKQKREFISAFTPLKSKTNQAPTSSPEGSVGSFFKQPKTVKPVPSRITKTARPSIASFFKNK